MSSEVNIIDRRSVPANGREISLFISGGDEKGRRVSVGRPTRFDEIVVSVLSNRISIPESSFQWPSNGPDFRRQIGNIVRSLEGRIAGPIHLRERYLETRMIEPNNVAHVMMEILPAALYAKGVCASPITVVARKIQSHVREIFHSFDVDVVETARAVVGSEVRLSVTRSHQVYDMLTVFDCEVAQFVGEEVFRALKLTRGGEPERIFLARRGKRAIANMAETQRLLQSRGYKTVYMEDYSVGAQLAIGQAARHVVAVHGAAMGWLMTNPKIHSLVELLPENVYQENFAMNLPCVDNYAIVIAGFDDRVPHLGYSEVEKYKRKPFSVDLQLLEKALDTVSG